MSSARSSADATVGRATVPTTGSTRPSHGRCGRDRGSASIWVLGGALLVFAVAAVGTLRGLAVLARHRAESAADLAALAAAGRIGMGDDPCARAVDIAARNGASVRSCRVQLGADGRSGVVRVVVAASVALPGLGARQVTASARAGREPAAEPPAGTARRAAWTSGIPP